MFNIINDNKDNPRVAFNLCCNIYFTYGSFRFLKKRSAFQLKKVPLPKGNARRYRS